MAAIALSDAELLASARNGDEAAFTELYVRHHAPARRLATTYQRSSDPDDLVNEAFERVLGSLHRGGGPTASFRAYLFVTLRRLAMEHSQRPGPDRLDEVPEPVMAPAGGPELDSTEREIVTRAFESLPDRWQTILWHTAVEGRPPRELAGVVGMSANATAALAYRARERLRQAYLQAHLQSGTRPQCEPHRSRLGGYVRDGLSRRDRSATDQHLQHCESCRELVDELGDVNRLLVRSVMPLFPLGADSPAGVTEPAAGTTAAASSTEVTDLASGLWGRIRNLGPVTVGAAAAGAVLLAATIIPHVTDSGDGPRPDVEVGGRAMEPDAARIAGGTSARAAQRRPTTTPSTTAPTTAGTVGDGLAGPGDDTVTPAADAGSGSLLDLEVPGVGLEADVGLDPLDVRARLDVDLGWVASSATEGTLTVRVNNDGSQALPDLELNLQLSTDAQVRVGSSGCGGSQGGVLGDVIGLVRSVTCSLGDLGAGSEAALDLPVNVTQPGQTATVLLRQAGTVISSETISLTTG